MILIELEPILDEIKKQKKIIAKARDKLRKIKNKSDTGIEIFDKIVENLESSIDLLSQYINTCY